MTTTNQQLATEGVITIPAQSVRDVQSEIKDKDGNALIPHFVQFEGDCPLVLLATSNDGKFTVWNPESSAITGTYRAHHLHSISQKPIPTITATITASTIQPPTCPGIEPA